MELKLDILAIVAHPDDAELGCGGTIIKEVANKKKIGIVDLTQGELGTRGSADIREQEAKAATKIMGLNTRENLAMSDGLFSENTGNIMRIIEAIRLYHPDLVFTNAIEDRHPDHARASQMVSRACFLSGLPKIETQVKGKWQDAWRPKHVYHIIQDRYIKPDFVVDITEQFEKKMEAIMAYKSQFWSKDQKGPKTPISSKDFLDFLEARAREMGRLIGVKYGEGFTTERPVGTESVFDFI